ncbi:ABC transporter ATP-binding protein [Paenibacillus albiflavus]|uniref:ABC transporter ATP-binding protein n=1 Tax=Paenibacillus albiflavus TaxID=2545760 RepID=A0A4R4EB67_9BACL|nr:ABC transporter ATP-binding protein [Paenibacillus albiflavus]TCZ75158.1 ABC transporter ATP-binding protein [Paenibacillus albiflavus]
MIQVTLEHISKQFGQAHGVSDVDVSIKPGEFFTLLGPSGCGKTTTLRMIAGFYYPTEGNILFGDENVTYLPPNKRNTGMVFQNYALFPHMTVFENVAFGLKVRKKTKDEIKQRVTDALKQVHLDAYASRRIDQLSGGQQQRVALARALVIEPNILLLDEPLSNLDAKLREETRLEIKKLQMELGITTIYVTHDQAEAMAMSDRIMVMQGGVVQQIGSPEEIYNRPVNRFVSTFIGETNLWSGIIERIEGNDVYVRLTPEIVICGNAHNSSPICKFEVGSEIAISIRPEWIRESSNANEEGLDVAGKVVVSEFTGMSVNYVTDIGGLQLRAMFINQGHRLRQRDEEISFFIPKESVYFTD